MSLRAPDCAPGSVEDEPIQADPDIGSAADPDTGAGAQSGAEPDLGSDGGLQAGEQGAGSRDRRCLVGRVVLPRDRLIRFVLSPDGQVTPDLAGKLPGRGAWVEASRSALDTAVRKSLFARAFSTNARAAPDLSDQVQGLLEERALSQLGLARRAGVVHAGFDQVRALAKSAKPAYIVEASDGAGDGRNKTLGLARAVWGDDIPVIGCFSAAQLGRVLGRDSVTHVALSPGRGGEGFSREVGRLAGFRPLAPEAWARHEG